jgi:hypothetical protein
MGETVTVSKNFWEILSKPPTFFKPELFWKPPAFILGNCVRQERASVCEIASHGSLPFKLSNILFIYLFDQSGT